MSITLMNEVLLPDILSLRSHVIKISSYLIQFSGITFNAINNLSLGINISFYYINLYTNGLSIYKLLVFVVYLAG